MWNIVLLQLQFDHGFWDMSLEVECLGRHQLFFLKTREIQNIKSLDFSNGSSEFNNISSCAFVYLYNLIKITHLLQNYLFKKKYIK